MFQGVWQRLRMWGWGGGAPKDLDALVRQEFGLRIRNRDYYDEALRHSSMLDGDTSGRMSNERLEFLGDTVLDLVVAGFLFRQFPAEQEGALTQRKSKIVNRKTLNLLGTKLGLPRFIVSKMRRSDVQESVVGNALEALIGALYLDHGFEATRNAVLHMLRRHGAIDKIHETVDFKSNLHHWAQRGRQTIEFRVAREHSDGSGYDMEVRIGGRVMGTGFGRSKKDAEQVAARQAWKAVYDLENRTSPAAEEPRSTPSSDSAPTESERSRGPQRERGRNRERNRGRNRDQDRDRNSTETSDRDQRKGNAVAIAAGNRPAAPAAEPPAPEAETPAPKPARAPRAPRPPRPPREPRSTPSPTPTPTPTPTSPPTSPSTSPPTSPSTSTSTSTSPSTSPPTPPRDRIRDRVRKRAEAKSAPATPEHTPTVEVPDSPKQTEVEKPRRSGSRRGGKQKPASDSAATEAES